LLNDFLEIGQRVTIEIAREDKSYFFSSKIEDLRSDRILIGMPMKSGRAFNTHVTEKIMVYFSNKHSFYCIDCTVEEKKYTPLPLLVLRPLDVPYKHQKRGYFRLEISLKVNLQTSENDRWLDGFTLNISASGAMIVFSQDIAKGSFINIRIPDILGDMIIRAKVIRNEKDLIREINPYNIALQFMDLEETEQDQIVKTLLEKQRKLRKKGLI